MLDAVLVEKCADPALKPAIVQAFVKAVGSTDPLSITVRIGNRLILVPKPRTPEEAMEIIRAHVGGAIVRVGITQLPAGIGARKADELKPQIVDACENLRAGTRIFTRIMKTVAKWYGNPTGAEVQPQIFDDAVHAWKTGEFEGTSVFVNPAVLAETPEEMPEGQDRTIAEEPDAPAQDENTAEVGDADKAGIRIDLSRIGGN